MLVLQYKTYCKKKEEDMASKKLIAVLMANVFVLCGYYNMHARGCSNGSGIERCSNCGFRKNSKKCNARPNNGFLLKQNGMRRCNAVTRMDEKMHDGGNGNLNSYNDQYVGNCCQNDQFDSRGFNGKACEDMGSPGCEFQDQKNNQDNGYSDPQSLNYRRGMSDRQAGYTEVQQNNGESNFNHDNYEHGERMQDRSLNAEYNNTDNRSSDFNNGYVRNDNCGYANNVGCDQYDGRAVSEQDHNRGGNNFADNMDLGRNVDMNQEHQNSGDGFASSGDMSMDSGCGFSNSSFVSSDEDKFDESQLGYANDRQGRQYQQVDGGQSHQYDQSCNAQGHGGGEYM